MLMKATTIRLGERALACADVAAVARGHANVELSEQTEEDLRRSHQRLASAVARGERVYGLTCGVGGLEHIDGDDPTTRQRNLLRSHAAGIGERMPADQVRAMMFVRLANLSSGASGIAPRAAHRIADLLNAGITPVVASRGSVGAADLAPLAEAFLPLIGEGRVTTLDGREHTAAAALAANRLEPITLSGRDGLALIAGLAQTTAIAALVAVDGRRLLEWSEHAAALSMAANNETTTALSPLAVSSKPHPGHVASAAAIRSLVGDVSTERLRSRMSSRVAAQVSGNLRELISDLEAVAARELAAPADNPLVSGDGEICNNAPGFDGHRLAAAIDGVTGAIISVAAAAERRTAALLDPNASNLPAYLVDPDGEPTLSSGLMLAQYTAAATVAEMNATWRPVAGLSIPTANNTEDLVSMAPIAARSCARLCRLARDVVAIELVCAAQAADLSGAALAPDLRAVHDSIRRLVPHLDTDRPLGGDFAAVASMIDGADPP